MSRRKVIALSMSGVALAGTGSAAAQGQGQPNRNFRAHLSALPDVDTDAQGQAKFKLSKDGTEMDYKLIVANIEDVLAAHIHLRPSGGVATGLSSGAPSGRFDGVLAEGTITDDDVSGPGGEDTLTDLVNELRAGNGFVRVHTAANPPGEIEGDIH